MNPNRRRCRIAIDAVALRKKHREVGADHLLVLWALTAGECVVDVGSGAGFGCFVAAYRVGDIASGRRRYNRRNASKARTKAAALNLARRAGAARAVPDALSLDIINHISQLID